MPETKVQWRVTYQDRISPNHVWVWNEEFEEHARRRYDAAVETDSQRRVTLERVEWVVSTIEVIEQTASGVD